MSHPNPSTAMATVVMDELERNGIRHVVIAPGSRSAALAMAAAASATFDVHVEVDERSAAFLALGIGRATGVPAVVVTTSGTAVANLHPAAVEADLGAVPLLLVTADRPAELRDRGANQTISQPGIFGVSPRWEFDPGVAEDRLSSNGLWRSMVSRAVAAADGRLGPRGPVHLNLQFREPLVPSPHDGRASADPFESPTEGRDGGVPWTIVDRAEPPPIRVEGRPGKTLVVAGDVGLPAGVDFGRLAIYAEPQSGLRSAATLSTLHYLASHPAGARFRPDSVHRLGRTGLSRPLDEWLAGVPTHVFDPHGRWLDPTSSAGALSVTELTLQPADPYWMQELDEIQRAVVASVTAFLDDTTVLTEPRVARDTARAVPHGGNLIVGSSMPVRDLSVFMEPSDITVHANRGASGIDGFVSTALGIAIGSGAPTVALAGDLSMLHDANGLLLAERPDCVFVVVDNDGGGIFSFLPQADHPETFEQVFGTPHGRDFADLARFHGIPDRPVSDPADLEGAIRASLEVGGVSIISVRTDRSHNVEVHRELTETAHRAIDATI